jgi:Ger(x)C family germination protein
VYLTFVILGEELAKTDVSPIMDVFSRHLHYKPNTLIAICKGGAYAFLTGSETLEEVEPSQSILKLITSAHDTVSACPMVTVHDFMVGYNTISIDPWAPYIGLVSTASAEQAAEEKSKPAAGSTSPGDAKQGQNDPNAKKIVKVLGTAVFSKVGAETKMVGSLDTWESLAALILRGDLRTGFINIAYPGDQAETTLLIQRAATSEDLSLNDGSVEVKFKIVATMSISESAVGKEILPEKEQQFRQAIVRTAEEQLLSLVQRTFLKLTALDSDVLGIGRSAQTKFRTYGEWEAFDWSAKYPRSTASFDIKVHIFTAGFTLEKPFPR